MKALYFFVAGGKKIGAWCDRQTSFPVLNYMEDKQYEKWGIKSPHEIQVYIPERWMTALYAANEKYGLPISQILLRVLANPKRIRIPDALTRPHNFHEKMHRFPMRFALDHKAVVYGRIKWARFEFGPVLRFLLEEYIGGLDELIQKTNGLDLAYEQTNTVEVKPRREVFHRGHKWHVYFYEMWAYIPASLRHENHPPRRVCRLKDLWWYKHPIVREIRDQVKDQLE